MTDVTQLFTDLVRCEVRLYNTLEDRLRAEYGLTAGQFSLLRIIGGQDDCRVADIARHVPIAVGAASKAVDRLEAAGWVSRRPNPANRRSSLISLTADGRRLLDAAAVTARAELAGLFDGALPPRALGELAAALARLRQVLEDAGAGLPAG